MSIAIVGEAWGAEEEKERTPFIGTSGYHLTKMLAEAGINRADCFLTNVFNRRPKGNKIETFCGSKAHAIKGYPTLLKGKYVRAEFSCELDRLGDELIEANPNLVLALGNTAMWAILGRAAISKFRGTTDLSTHTVEGFKVLPTYHPAAVLRAWDLRPVVISDLIKAKRESLFPEIRRPKREIWIEPTLEDLEAFYNQHINGAEILSVDIETSGNQITCIGFAPSPWYAIVIPFLDIRKKDRNYWPTTEKEIQAWKFVRRVLNNPKPPKLFQNGTFDVAFLWRACGIKVVGATEDSMLLHHALQPESLKSLGFLGSLYCDDRAWKHMREKNATIKRDN